MKKLSTKCRTYLRMKAELAKLEQDIRAEAKPILFAEGFRALPRTENIINRFAT